MLGYANPRHAMQSSIIIIMEMPQSDCLSYHIQSACHTIPRHATSLYVTPCHVILPNCVTSAPRFAGHLKQSWMEESGSSRSLSQEAKGVISR